MLACSTDKETKVYVAVSMHLLPKCARNTYKTLDESESVKTGDRGRFDPAQTRSKLQVRRKPMCKLTTPGSSDGRTSPPKLFTSRCMPLLRAIASPTSASVPRLRKYSTS